MTAEDHDQFRQLHRDVLALHAPVVQLVTLMERHVAAIERLAELVEEARRPEFPSAFEDEG